MVKNLKAQLREERRKNEALTAENQQLRADLEFVAIMADVEIPEPEFEGGMPDESEG